MYTFNKEALFTIENKTRETWYWGPHTFRKINPTVKYEYEGSTLQMVSD